MWNSMIVNFEIYIFDVYHITLNIIVFGWNQRNEIIEFYVFLGLDKTETIGDIGSRSFYMRKCKDNNSFMGSEVISTKGNSSPPQNNRIIVFPNIVSNSFKKILRSCGKLSKIIGCIDKWFLTMHPIICCKYIFIKQMNLYKKFY